MYFEHYDAIIVGAGFAGATIAHQLAVNHKKVLVIDKRDHIAGNMYEDYDHARVRVHRYGPHIFHTNEAEVVQFLQQFGEWFPYEHRVLGKIDNQLVPIPFNFTSIDRLFTRKEAQLLKEKLKKTFPDQEKISVLTLKEAADFDLKKLGEYVFEKVFVHYTAKQWGVSIEKVDTSTINRVPIHLSYDDRYFQDVYQHMPKDGYTKIFEKMLSHKNIEVKLGVNAKDFLTFQENNFLYKEKICKIPFIFTGAVDEILDYRFGPLPYRSLHLEFENYNLATYQPACVVNYPNEETFTRITEFKYLTRQMAASTTILKEYPKIYDHRLDNTPYYPINNEANDALFMQYATYLKKYDNFYLCGRLAEYKYYNMDAVILQALQVAKKILK